MHLSIGIASQTRAFGKTVRGSRPLSVQRSIEPGPISAPDRAAVVRLLIDEEQRAFAGT